MLGKSYCLCIGPCFFHQSVNAMVDSSYQLAEPPDIMPRMAP